MAKQNILIVDSDPSSLGILEASLKKAGYCVTKAVNGIDALEKIQLSVPELIISETDMPGLDGFGLYAKLREESALSRIPFIFLTAQKSNENKIRCLELGVDDYLTKPTFISEITARINLVLQRSLLNKFDLNDSKSRFSGNFSDISVVDLIQAIETSGKSGVMHVKHSHDEGKLFFRDGKAIDATTRYRKGSDAVYRMMTWSDAGFEIEFTKIDRKDRIELSTQETLTEGMRRLEEWNRLQEHIPPLTSVFDVDASVLSERLGEMPDEVNAVIKHFDARRSLMDVVNRCSIGDLEALKIINKLILEKFIKEVTTETRRQTSPLAKARPLAEAETGIKYVSQPSSTEQDSSLVKTITGNPKHSGHVSQATLIPAPAAEVSVIKEPLPIRAAPNPTFSAGHLQIKNLLDTAKSIGGVTQKADSAVESQTSTSPEKSLTDSGSIAAALDAEAPPPSADTKVEEDKPRTEETTESHESPDLTTSIARITRSKRLAVSAVLLAVLALAFAMIFFYLRSNKTREYDNASIVNPPSSFSEYKSALSGGRHPEDTIVEGTDVSLSKDNEDSDSSLLQKPEDIDTSSSQESENTNTVENAPKIVEQVTDNQTVVDQEKTKKYDQLMAKAKNLGPSQKERILREAIALNPNGDEAIASLAAALMEGRKTRSEALELAGLAASINPDNGTAWLVLGYIKQLNGDKAGAVEAYQKCSACSGPPMHVKECRKLVR